MDIICVCMCVFVDACKCVYVCMYVCMYVCIYVGTLPGGVCIRYNTAFEGSVFKFRFLCMHIICNKLYTLRVWKMSGLKPKYVAGSLFYTSIVQPASTCYFASWPPGTTIKQHMKFLQN
jgi:hypothetical protein